MCHKIFILDDSDADRLALSELFESEGYEVETFADADSLAAGIDARTPPDVLVTDFMLGNSTCLPVVNKYRYIIPYIICATGNYDNQDKIFNLYQAGVTDVQPKTSITGLILSVRTMMTRAKAGKHKERLLQAVY